MLFSKFLSEDWSGHEISSHANDVITYIEKENLLNIKLYVVWFLVIEYKIVICKEIEDREKESSDENAGIKEEEK